jgi:hypothetical protein
MINHKKNEWDLKLLSKLFNKEKGIVKEEKCIQQTIQEETTNGGLNLSSEPLLQQYTCNVTYEADEKCIPTIPLYSNDLDSATENEITGLKLARARLHV